MLITSKVARGAVPSVLPVLAFGALLHSVTANAAAASGNTAP